MAQSRQYALLRVSNCRFGVPTQYFYMWLAFLALLVAGDLMLYRLREKVSQRDPAALAFFDVTHSIGYVPVLYAYAAYIYPGLR